MAMEPVMWGYICSGKFSAEISYCSITPALFFHDGADLGGRAVRDAGRVAVDSSLGLVLGRDPTGTFRERALGSREWVWSPPG